MKIDINDKFVMTKSTRFIEEGTAVTVTKIENGIIHFVFGESSDGGSGYMDTNTFEAYFKKIEKKAEKPVAPAVCTDYIEIMLENSDFEAFTTFDKCTIVSCKLPNGFVITESSACVSPENYNKDMGFEICYNKIFDKVCELEAYKLQDAIYTKLNEDDDEELDECDCTCTGCCCECNNYDYDEGVNNHIYY